MQSYYQAFFAEEEKRIAPALRNGLSYAQELAGRLPLTELLVELTQGVHFEEPFKESNLVLVPGYWNTPYVIFPKIRSDTLLILFGVRPQDMSLVPGEQVPDTLLLVLKAMADPTRLKIMRYLNEESLTPTEIARRLRLRARQRSPITSAPCAWQDWFTCHWMQAMKNATPPAWRPSRPPVLT